VRHRVVVCPYLLRGRTLKRQALCRLEWDDDGTEKRPPPVFAAQVVGPWGPTTEATLIYEGPSGRTTVTVEAVVDEPATKEAP
jgi:hypothetical protein